MLGTQVLERVATAFCCQKRAGDHSEFGAEKPITYKDESQIVPVH